MYAASATPHGMKRLNMAQHKLAAVGMPVPHGHCANRAASSTAASAGLQGDRSVPIDDLSTRG